MGDKKYVLIRYPLWLDLLPWSENCECGEHPREMTIEKLAAAWLLGAENREKLKSKP